MFNEKENRKENDGIKYFLWCVEASKDAQRSGRIVVFGHGRNSTFKPDNSVDINMDEIIGKSSDDDNKDS